MNHPGITVITKASGEHALFSEDKLRQSLERSGAGPEDVKAIIHEVQKHLYDRMPTREIYTLAFSLLKKQSRAHAGRYKMKQAIMELGPSGFPFEKYLAEILNFQGYQTETNQMMTGHCVTHEVDVLARKDKRICIIECKFHNRPGLHCDVKVPLYIHSRFRDIEHAQQRLDSNHHEKPEGWLVTNTRFTSDAIQYGVCAGLRLLGWNYPRKGSLQEWIETSGLYPVTCLTTLTKEEKVKVLALGLVLCKDLPAASERLLSIGIAQSRIAGIVRESSELAGGHSVRVLNT